VVALIVPFVLFFVYIICEMKQNMGAIVIEDSPYYLQRWYKSVYWISEAIGYLETDKGSDDSKLIMRQFQGMVFS